jgi:hypothetical protein
MFLNNIRTFHYFVNQRRSKTTRSWTALFFHWRSSHRGPRQRMYAWITAKIRKSMILRQRRPVLPSIVQLPLRHCHAASLPLPPRTMHTRCPSHSVIQSTTMPLRLPQKHFFQPLTHLQFSVHYTLYNK